MNSIIRYCIGTIVIGVILSSAAVAADRYVDSGATGANNGSSWADAWTTITAAMTGAAAGDTIHVAAGATGKYSVTSTTGWTPANSPLTMVVKTGETVVLSGDINGNDTFADLTVDPCALAKAATSGTHSENGRILNLAGKNMTITGFVFDGGAAIGNGGSMTTSGSTVLILNDCRIQQSFALGRGGAIYHNSSGTLTLNDCRFNHTSSWNTGSIIRANGTGGIHASNCCFQNAEVIDSQAAIQPGEASADNTFTNCVFDRCRMRNNIGGSGGIMTSFEVDSTLTVTHCVFKECMTYHHGAAVYARADNTSVSVTANVSNCLVFGCSNWQPTGTNLAFYAEADDPCSVVVLNLTNCTVANNHTNGQGHIGGWVYDNDANAGATINLKNCIVWGNVGDTNVLYSDKAQLFNDTSTANPGSARVTLTANYCCWDNSDPNDWGHAQDLGSNNLLVTSISGGTTGDPYLNPLLSGYMLDADSPCIDAGDPCSAYSAEPKCNGGRINMGWLGGTALATPTTTTTKLADLNCDDEVDLADFSAMAEQWMQ